MDIINIVNIKDKIIEILDNGLYTSFQVNFNDLKGKLKPNTPQSMYAAFVIYYLKNDIGLKVNTIASLFEKSHDKISIQLGLFNKHVEMEKNNIIFSHTISRDRKEMVERLYPKFIHCVKTFALEIFAKEYEKSLKEYNKMNRKKHV